MRRPGLPRLRSPGAGWGRAASPPAAAGDGIRRFWFGGSLAFRRRTVAALLVLGVYALIRFVPLPGLPCELSPAKECAPVDDAIALVPAEAYAYAHLNLDRDASQFEQARELAAELPNFAALAQGSLRALGPGRALDLRLDVYPWLGEEAAAAEVSTRGGRASPLLLLAVADRAGARAFLAKIGGSSADRKEHRGTEVSVYPSGLASAERDGFLLLGAPAAVRASIDAGAGETEGLGESERAEAVRDQLTDPRLADAYVSEDGIDRLLAGRGGVAAQLDTFTDFGASEGIAAALVAHEGGLGVELVSELDPEATKASPSFFSAFAPFEPGLASAFGADTPALLAVGDPSRTVRLLLEQADAAVPGIAEGFDRLNKGLARDGGIDIEQELLPLLGGEAAVGLSPARPVPYVTAVFDDVDEDRARQAMAQLQAPLIAALDPARTGQAPTLSSRRFEGVRVESVGLGPALEPAYAVFDGRLAVSSDPRGVEQAIRGGEDLAGADLYRAATSSSGGEVSALLFLNLAGLVQLAEPRGLAEIVSDFREDLARLRALGLVVRSSTDRLRTEIFLNIEQPKEPSP